MVGLDTGHVRLSFLERQASCAPAVVIGSSMHDVLCKSYQCTKAASRCHEFQMCTMLRKDVEVEKVSVTSIPGSGLLQNLDVHAWSTSRPGIQGE